VKPPRIAELVARLETVTRRVVIHAAPVQAVVSQDVRVDLTAHRVEVAGRR
jgi:DNA-binding response OmpR family regulator